MELIPAIDLLGGRVVRLHQGDYNQVTVYSNNPAEQARQFYEAGARRLHVIDLEGAKVGKPQNIDSIREIVREVPISVQVGGGIRNRESALLWFDAGAKRVVFGTAAIKEPELVQNLCQEYPDGVIVAVDSRGGKVAVEGWLEDSGRSDVVLAQEVDRWGVAAILHTVIDRDGTREGPDVQSTVSLQKMVRTTVIASGGIGTLQHIGDLVKAGVRSAVCGRALYSGVFSLEQAFDAAKQ